MIFGIGTDLVDIARFDKAPEQQNKLANKILSADELNKFKQVSNPAAYLAKRFAAKEALAKALATGIREPILFPNISVMNDDLGKPYFEFSAQLQEYIESRDITAIHLSLSDVTLQAVSFVVIEC